jgi:hypothetical protein
LAARDAGLAHTIWSTFEDTRRWVPLDDDRMPTLQGRFKVPHYDAKGEADALFTTTREAVDVMAKSSMPAWMTLRGEQVQRISKLSDSVERSLLRCLSSR